MIPRYSSGQYSRAGTFCARVIHPTIRGWVRLAPVLVLLVRDSCLCRAKTPHVIWCVGIYPVQLDSLQFSIWWPTRLPVPRF